MKTTPASTNIPASESKAPPLPRKLGANHSETATRPRKHHNNFKQSKDVREDRDVRQWKTSSSSKPARGGC
jgi:hypothetical protein